MKTLTLLQGGPIGYGAIVTPQGINFSIFSKDAVKVSLCFFESPVSPEPYATLDFDPAVNKSGDVWHALVPEAKPGDLYLYRIDGPHEPERGLRFDYSRYLLDPYAKCYSEGSVYKAYAESSTRGLDTMYIKGRDPMKAHLFPKCVVIDDGDFDWEGDRPLNVPLDKSVIYEVHLKGFTASPSSGVQNPGTYKGFAEKIQYLKDLGVTAVEFLPIQEFDENENGNINPKSGERLTNYWGYSTIGFFAPKNTYAADRSPGGPVREFKSLVKELHKAGLEVILDVVYNHTSEGNEHGYTFEFKGIQNDQYYILPPDKQYYMNYSGCGNTFNCNQPNTMNFIMDSLRYWVQEMHVDGFRFDLASILCRDQWGQMNGFPPLTNWISVDPILANTKIIAEPWDAGGGYQVGYFPGGRWSEWNDRYRDDVRRFVRGDEFTSTAAATRISGSSDIYLHTGKKPASSINYISCHDGFTMNDVVSYNGKKNDENGEENRDGSDNNNSYNHGYEGECTNAKIEGLRLRQLKNFIAILMVSQGVPMLLGGDEFRRTQKGNNNAYCQDNEISWFDWNFAQKNKELLDFTRAMIALRKAHPTFSRKDFFGESEAEKKRGVDVVWYDFDGRIPDWSKLNRFLACVVYGRDFDKDFYLAANTDTHDMNLILPTPEDGKLWARVVDTSFPAGEEVAQEGKEEVLQVQNRYVIPANSFVLLTALPRA